ncbi:type IX secretion system motor protein PorL/GldL [Aquirufa aurantiipilula]|uniref:type IX secretion system motor protein PorL/GldL n=1 Tax=Aquirufa aurantiipilula TaxID=2696561 RepID=UPI001CAA643D|nr:gliding motility protein GldL [Aquirufa aurantiipilula]MBZ1326431.1 gliding motility protein GldL [Aquirufa aurantiipilula]
MEKSINVIASFGAAVVIVGALFKIVHWDGANEMLMVGMFTEAAIFILFGVLYLQAKPEKSYDWEKVYPELVGGAPVARPTSTGGVDALASLKGLGPEVVEGLTKSLKGLTETANSLQDISKATVATQDFVKALSSSSESLGTLNKSVSEAANSLGAISVSSVEAAKYAQQYAKAGDQLSTLNTIYETEIQEATKHLKAINSYYGNVNLTVEQMAATQKDAELFKTELAKLNANIQSLNQVYGSMLTAMKG